MTNKTQKPEVFEGPQNAGPGAWSLWHCEGLGYQDRIANSWNTLVPGQVQPQHGGDT